MKNLTARVLAWTLALAFLVAPALAGAESYSLQSGNDGRALPRFALNFEADGTDAGGITFNVNQVSLSFNPSSGAWEGSGRAELTNAAGVHLIADNAASIVLVLAPSGGGAGCPENRIASLSVSGVGAGPGEHFSFIGSGSVDGEQFGCPHSAIKGLLQVGQGKGLIKKSMGAVKGAYLP